MVSKAHQIDWIGSFLDVHFKKFPDVASMDFLHAMVIKLNLSIL